ncbi:hypothetical protein N7504_005742 [Penicillium tannophilum]|nr:hypothetical protein N7504_005742 [Penicillium tannophilum]
MQISDLPNELISLISEYLDDENCINSLLQTCKRLFLLLNHSLYEHNVRYSHACALEWAAKHGFETTARYALEAGASVDSAHYEEWVPMALACIHGHENVVRLLLDRGVDPNAVEGWTRLEEDIDGDYGSPVALAAGRGHASVVRLLLAYNAAPDTPTELVEETPLTIAARGGHLSVVKIFVEAGCDIQRFEQSYYTPLYNAACEGHTEVVRYLLEMGAVTDSDRPITNTPLSIAATKGYLKIVDLLLKASKVQTPLMVPLARAAQHGHQPTAERLLESADWKSVVNCREPGDDDSKLLFLASAACGWGEIVRRLLERGCLPDTVPPENVYWSLEDKAPNVESPRSLMNPSALALAAQRGHLGILEQLLHYKSDLSQEYSGDKDPNPLVLAVSEGHKDVATMLLDHGANPNYQSSYGGPVLFRAVRTPKMFQLLLDRGADPQSRTKANGPVLAMALSKGTIATVEILLRRIPFHLPPSDNANVYSTLFTKAAEGGVSMLDFVLSRGYQVVPGSREVEEVLNSALYRADAALVRYLFERGLIGSLCTFLSKNLIGLVKSPTGDAKAVAATMDALLAHGVDIETEERSPFSDALERKRFHDSELDGHTDFYFQLLLDRGADPLHGDTCASPLGEAAKEGLRKVVQSMLKALDQRDVSLEKLQTKLAWAEEQTVEEGHLDIVALLQRAYWRKKYQTVV